MQLVRPGPEHLAAYTEALQRGWSPNTLRPVAAAEELQRIKANPQTFLGEMDDPDGKAPPITLPDGAIVARIPSFRRWMWDEEFCGSIGLRWQLGTTALPPHVLGHVGYTVVPWKQRRGYATEALRQLLPMAQAAGLPFVELVTDPGNSASRRVIEANGGILIEEFAVPTAHGGTPGLRYRIALGGCLPEP